MNAEQINRKLKRIFFEIASDGVLVYRDHAIGRLANTEKQLRVTTNMAEQRFELKVADHITKVIEWQGNFKQACRDAFYAYFCTFKALTA